MKNTWIGSWLFVFGSVIFTFDASIDLLEVCSFRASLRLLACLLFTVGCFLLMPTGQESDRTVSQKLLAVANIVEGRGAK